MVTTFAGIFGSLRAPGVGRTVVLAITRCGQAVWGLDRESAILSGRPFDSPD